MNTSNNQTEQNEKQSCVDYCTKSFETPGQEIVNSYKCKGRAFSSADIWNVQKQRIQVSIKEFKTSIM